MVTNTSNPLSESLKNININHYYMEEKQISIHSKSHLIDSVKKDHQGTATTMDANTNKMMTVTNHNSTANERSCSDTKVINPSDTNNSKSLLSKSSSSFPSLKKRMQEQQEMNNNENQNGNNDQIHTDQPECLTKDVNKISDIDLDDSSKNNNLTLNTDYNSNTTLDMNSESLRKRSSHTSSMNDNISNYSSQSSITSTTSSSENTNSSSLQSDLRSSNSGGQNFYYFNKHNVKNNENMSGHPYHPKTLQNQHPNNYPYNQSSFRTQQQPYQHLSSFGKMNQNRYGLSHHSFRQLSSPILKDGLITHKKGLLINTKKYGMLCAPRKIEDLKKITTRMFPSISSHEPELNQAMVTCYGHLSHAAIQGSPLFILLNADQDPTTAQYLHFEEVVNYMDEREIQQACYFEVNLLNGDYRFKCKTSTDYQEWISAVSTAYTIATKKHTRMPSLVMSVGSSSTNPHSSNGSLRSKNNVSFSDSPKQILVSNRPQNIFYSYHPSSSHQSSHLEVPYSASSIDGSSTVSSTLPDKQETLMPYLHRLNSNMYTSHDNPPMSVVAEEGEPSEVSISPAN